MSFRIITAEEAASFINNGDNIGISGFSPSGTPKAIPKALAERAKKEHKAGKEFKVGLMTGGATGDAIDGELIRADALLFRTPYQESRDLRDVVNSGKSSYFDLHLSVMAQDIKYGFIGKVNVAIIEVADISDDGELILTTGVGITPTIARLADKILIERNASRPSFIKGIHDLCEIPNPPYRKELAIYKPDDRIGSTVLKVDPSKVLGIVETDGPDAIKTFSEPNEMSLKVGHNVVKFLVGDLEAGRIPKGFLPVQSGVGNVGNVVIGSLATHPEVPPFKMFTEVIQNSVIDKVLSGDISFVSGCSLTLTKDVMRKVFENWDFLKDKFVLRPSEISNNPEIIRRMGVIAINTALEADIYGNVNSSHVCGTRLMNGIGGSCDFTRSAYISIYTCPSVAKDGKISTIVPMVSHVDHNEHDVKIIVTDQGIADLRDKCPEDRAKLVIENCAHPDYKQLLWDYLKCAKKGHISHNLAKAFNMHIALEEKGDMRYAKF